MLGLTGCSMASLAGASDVICCDIAPERFSKAREFGASHVASPRVVEAIISDITKGYGVDVLLEVSGSTDALEQALPLMRLGGTAVLAGAVFPSRTMQLDPERIVRRNLTIRGVHNYSPRNLAAALDFLATAAPRFPLASLVSTWLPLSSAQDAFEAARNGHTYRVGIRP
ncbi:MAG TPA: zinc-binding dehydrogenase [Pirellulales bacterium]|nr:zinc-binding dehydrogenase [Pirellulales bacterium]